MDWNLKRANRLEQREFKNVSDFDNDVAGNGRALLRINGHCNMSCAFCFVDRGVEGRYPPLRSPGLGLSEGPGEAIAVARAQPPVRAYAYRSLDRRLCLADARLGDFLRPSLWWVAGPRQVYLGSLLTGALGPGPAAMGVAGAVGAA